MPINPLDRIQAHYDSFTKTDLEIAIFIINNPREAARMTPDNLAQVTKVSKSALIRFSKKIGYSGYSEFKFDLSRLLIGDNKRSESKNDNEDSLIAITNMYSQHIKDIANQVSHDDLEMAAELILNAKKIKIVGNNRTYNSALQFRQRMSKIGIDSEAINDFILFSDIIDIMGPNDLTIIFTSSNNSNYDNFIANLYTNKCPILAITMSNDLPFKKKCKRIITLPRISANSSISFLDDQAIFFVFIEVLLNVLASKMPEKED